ncbi:hypothetical protein [Streptomyces sp. SP18CS02]|uniref:hypothetical protein n=1 Tax=Streptomyces sp. SP18CS02 TaxID=3002531 RepID=UPI002E79C48D|nr:hypothetical protein [Streptomyces sp. SP18CS02]MEE1752129.1 hypothetical protein [Streptomyces sp. SP18CS02]
MIVGKKQTRQNRGARTGGHERSAAAEAKEQAKSSAAAGTVHPAAEQVAHRQQRRFGHN